MHLKYYLSSALLLLPLNVVAQFDSNIVALMTQLPSCTQKCALTAITTANCSMTDIVGCVCSNPTLKAEVAVCAMQTCTKKEQFIATKFTQEKICQGRPVPTRQHELIYVNIILAIIAYPAVILRFVSRLGVARRLWWDDWCMVAAVCCMIPITTIALFHAHRGFGLHFWDVPADNIVLLRKLYYVVQVLYCLVLAVAKLSILFLYLQIFPSRNFQRWAKFVMALVVAKALVFIPLVLFQCRPVRSIWTQEPAKCIDSQMLVYWGAGVSIVEDLLIMFLPIFEVKQLQLSKRTRIGLGVMFALGSFACITSMVRLKFIVAYRNSIDVTWDNLDVYMWSEIEVFTAVFCSCLICIRPLFKTLIPRWFGFARTITSHKGGASEASTSSTISKKQLHQFQRVAPGTSDSDTKIEASNLSKVYTPAWRESMRPQTGEIRIDRSFETREEHELGVRSLESRDEKRAGEFV